MIDQGDVLLFQTTDDGEIDITNGVAKLSGGLETAVYISLFGGNQEDDGSESNVKTWWANLNENEKDKKIISETQYLLKSIPAIPVNLKRIEAAVLRDLSWLTGTLEVVVSIPGLNKIKIEISLENDKIEFTENWKVEA